MTDHHIVLTGEIKASTANAFVATLANLATQQATRVTVAINSGGGEVVHGIAMYNAMLAMPFPIVTHNVGNVDSIANVVFLGGAERYVCPASIFMFHGVGFNATAMGFDIVSSCREVAFRLLYTLQQFGTVHRPCHV